MKQPSLENSIVRYLTNEATASDLDFLSEWIKNPMNEKIFDSYVKIHYEVTTIMNKPNVDNIKENLIKHIKRDKNPFYNKRVKTVLKYAAVITIAFGLGYFFKQGYLENQSQFTEPIIVNNQIETGSDKATLTLATGEEITLIKGTNYKTANAKSNGEEITYQTSSKQQTIGNQTASSQIAYNTLTIPRGGQFFINLSDGTKVWLNSESQIRYPISFTDGETRQVDLIYGEAYFDVSSSTNHKGSKFKVFNNSQEVEVLGTEFNIKAYKDETNIYTTLVEGKVAINTANQNQILSPGEQSNFNIQLNTIEINEVDLFREISWKDGTFSFKQKSLKNIMTVLSRWYDMDVVFENKELENVTFNGTLYKNQSIEEILVFIQGSINTYEINNKTITLK